MKIVECPSCESKFDIAKAPEGMKLKCGKCQKIFGVVQGGEMVPVFAGIPKAAPLKAKRPLPPPLRRMTRRAAPTADDLSAVPMEPGMEDEFQSETPLPAQRRRRATGNGISALRRASTTSRFRRGPSYSEVVRAVEKKDRPEALLVITGLIGLVGGLGMLLGVILSITTPMNDIVVLQERLEKISTEKTSSKKSSKKKDTGKEEKIKEGGGEKPEEKKSGSDKTE